MPATTSDASLTQAIRAAAHPLDELVPDYAPLLDVWRNADVVEFVERLRLHNDALPADAPKVGFPFAV